MTKFGVNGFTEALRQDVTKRHVRVLSAGSGGTDWALGPDQDDRSFTGR